LVSSWVIKNTLKNYILGATLNQMFNLITFLFPKYRKTKQYYSLFIGESSLEDVFMLINNIPTQKIHVTGKIKFQKLPYGISRNKTRLLLGYPDCTHKFEYEDLHHTIYTYDNIGKVPGLIANCHFFDNRLHYIQTCIRHPDSEAKNKVAGIFKKRYDYELQDIDTVFALTNETGEVLYYNFNIDINLYHFSANHYITDRIRKAFLNQKSKLLAAKQKEVNILEEII
jgi:hypothetical protein